MLHFCSVNEIKGILNAGERFGPQIDMVREATTDDFNRYLRRNMEWQEGVEEILDSQDTRAGLNIWLKKKAIDPDSFEVWYSRSGVFEDDATLARDINYTLDAEKGKLVMLGYMRSGVRVIRVRYNGGWKPREDDTTAMKCPANVRLAAVDHAIYLFRRSTGANQGQATDKEGKQQVKIKPLVDGVLYEASRALNPYRSYLGR